MNLKKGDLVMFANSQSTYAKWFYGKLGVVRSSGVAASGKNHCRVDWIDPVPYFGSFSTYSDFGAENFVIC